MRFDIKRNLEPIIDQKRCKSPTLTIEQNIMVLTSTHLTFDRLIQQFVKVEIYDHIDESVLEQVGYNLKCKMWVVAISIHFSQALCNQGISEQFSKDAQISFKIDRSIRIIVLTLNFIKHAIISICDCFYCVMLHFMEVELGFDPGNGISRPGKASATECTDTRTRTQDEHGSLLGLQRLDFTIICEDYASAVTKNSLRIPFLILSKCKRRIKVILCQQTSEFIQRFH